MQIPRLSSTTNPCFLFLIALIIFSLSPHQSKAIGIVSSSLPEATTLQISTGRVSYDIVVQGTPVDTPAARTYPYQVYVTGNDIYENTVYISVAQGSVNVKGQISNPGGTPEAATTDSIAGSFTVPNDGTLATGQLQLIVEIYDPGTPYPTTTDLLGTSPAVPRLTSGTLTIEAIPDISIPAVQQIVKTQAIAGVPTLTANGTLSEIPVATSGAGYDPAFPPTVTITPNGNATVYAIVEQTTGSITGFNIVNSGNFSAVPAVTIAAPPSYMTQRTGGLLYSSGSYYGGDIVSFRTSVRNSQQGRPLPPADTHRLQTVLTTDPAYTAQSGSDDFRLFFTTISGDGVGSVGEGSPIRGIQVTGTPNGFTQAVPPELPNGGTVPPTYGLPHATTGTTVDTARATASLISGVST